MLLPGFSAIPVNGGESGGERYVAAMETMEPVVGEMDVKKKKKNKP